MKQLDGHEAFAAGLVGYQRMFRVRAKGFRQPRGEAEDAWGVHIDGAMAEAMVAKNTEKYWHMLCDNFKDVPDVGNLEVRHTRYENGGMLLHPTDKDDRKYVLVAGVWPAMKIVGWIWGKNGKHPDYWRDDLARPCFWVPQASLEEYETL